MGKKKTTPADLDYLFERDIIDEDDYIDFWVDYWKADTAKERAEVVETYTELAVEAGTDESVGFVTKDKRAAEQQAQALNDLSNTAYKVVRRNARGQFSKLGHYYQAVKK